METLSSTEVYGNAWLSVREDSVRRPDGSAGTYSVIDSRDIALIIATEDDRLHLVEQYRYAVEGRRWEFPSGSAPGVDLEPRALAARELREETGLRAEHLSQLGALEVMPGMSGMRCRVFLATDLTAGEPERELEEQDMRSRWFTRDEVERKIVEGEISDSKTMAAYTLLLLHERA